MGAFCPKQQPVNGGEKELGPNGSKKIPMFRTNEIIHDDKVLKKYEIKQIIGTGTFSNVFRVESKETKLPYAVKVISLRTLTDRELYQAERSVLDSVKHHHIVKFHEIIESEFSAYLVMELATGGDLLEKIQVLGRIKEKETIRIMHMLVDAIHYLHKNNITHRDLKPENILFYTPGEESRIILTDFGFASYKNANNNMLSTYCGTLQYLSPEIILQEKYTNKVDIWSLGVIVYFMLAGHLPFVSNDVTQLSHMITSVPHTFKSEIWKTISENAKKFIRSSLVKNPTHRMDSETALNHQWLQNHETKEACSNITPRNVPNVTENVFYIPPTFDRIEEKNIPIETNRNQNSRHKNKVNFSDALSNNRKQDKRHSLVIAFDSSANILSKSDILAQSFISSDDTRSICNSQRSLSYDGHSKINFEHFHQYQKNIVNKPSMECRQSAINKYHLPPITPQKRKTNRKLSYQEDFLLYRTLPGLLKQGDANKQNVICDTTLFAADCPPIKDAWASNLLPENQRPNFVRRSRHKNIITRKSNSPSHSKYKRSHSADAKITHSV